MEIPCSYGSRSWLNLFSKLLLVKNWNPVLLLVKKLKSGALIGQKQVKHELEPEEQGTWSNRKDVNKIKYMSFFHFPRSCRSHWSQQKKLFWVNNELKLFSRFIIKWRLFYPSFMREGSFKNSSNCNNYFFSKLVISYKNEYIFKML
jgi:hypothetical protein